MRFSILLVRFGGNLGRFAGDGGGDWSLFRLVSGFLVLPNLNSWFGEPRLLDPRSALFTHVAVFKTGTPILLPRLPPVYGFAIFIDSGYFLASLIAVNIFIGLFVLTTRTLFV